MKHYTVEVTTSNSYGGRDAVATVRVDAPDADVALDLVIASHGLEGVTLKADQSYTLKCVGGGEDVLTTRFGDEFTGPARATDASTFVEPTPEPPTPRSEEEKQNTEDFMREQYGLNADASGPAKPSRQDEVDFLGISPDELNKRLDEGWSMETYRSLNGKLFNVELIEPDPDYDSGHFSLIGDVVVEEPLADEAFTKVLEKFKDSMVKDKPPFFEYPWDRPDATPMVDVRETAQQIYKDAMVGLPVHSKRFQIGGIIKDPAPRFPHTRPPIHTPMFPMPKQTGGPDAKMFGTPELPRATDWPHIPKVS